MQVSLSPSDICQLQRQHLSNRGLNIIVNKGISHNLMKIGAKRRRTKEEIRQAKQMEAERLRDIDEKVQRINQMEHRE